MTRKLFATGWFVFFAWLIGTGCAAQCNSPKAEFGPPPVINSLDSAQTAAMALAFDPAPSIESMSLDLSRESRERAAFVGFEDQTQTFYYLQVDNHQGRHGHDDTDRHDYIDRVGVSYR